MLPPSCHLMRAENLLFSLIFTLTMLCCRIMRVDQSHTAAEGSGNLVLSANNAIPGRGESSDLSKRLAFGLCNLPENLFVANYMYTDAESPTQ